MGLLSFKTAQKLQILGYDRICNHAYHEETPLMAFDSYNCRNSCLKQGVIAAPEQNDVYDWLYNKLNILVTGDLAINDDESEMWFVPTVTKVRKEGGRVLWNQRVLPDKCSSPEQAVRKAIDDVVFQLNANDIPKD